jgi:Zn-dependent peptidase ImmA (M78 family)
MTLRRGFKSEANDLAREVRAELELDFLSPLDPRKLAAHLDIPIVALSEFEMDAPAMAAYFAGTNRSDFSALTVFRGSRRLIVYNDSHTRARQASDLAHELSHGLLLHEPKPALNAAGCRDWDGEVEEEADWLAGILLVPDDAAVALARNHYSDADAAKRYGVSEPLMRWRLNVSGARLRAKRTAAKYARLTGRR